MTPTQTIRQIIARSGLDAYNEEISAACDAIDAQMASDAKLRGVCMEFVEHHRITCGEAIYQRDAIYEKAPELVESICQVIGYHPSEDEAGDE